MRRSTRRVEALMDSRSNNALPKTYDRETVTHAERADSQTAPPVRAIPQIVAGSGPHLTSQTQPLLRKRLRAAVRVLLAGFGAFLVRHVAGLLTGEPLDRPLLGLHVVV